MKVCELWSELPPNRQRRTTGQQQQRQQQPTTKARHEHRRWKPNGNKRLHGVGRPRRPNHTKGANSPAKNHQDCKRKQGAKTQTKQPNPPKKKHEGKATPKGVQVGKTNDPEGRHDQQQTNKHKSRMDKGPKNLLHTDQPSLHSINVTRLISNNPTIPRR